MNQKTADIVRIALLQHACPVTTLGSPEVNWEVMISGMNEAAKAGVKLVLTQELFAQPYFPREENEAYFDLAESIPGPTTKLIGDWAKKLKLCVVISLFEKRSPGIYHNSLVAIDEKGEVAGVYRKMHIPHDPGFHEKYYFTPGGGGASHEADWPIWELAGIKVGPLICWDQWFPEAARIKALQGAQLLIYPTAIGGLSSEMAKDKTLQREAWLTVQRSHAICNGLYVAGINRVGQEGQIEFWGSSFVYGPDGDCLEMADTKEEEIVVADLDLNAMESVRRTWPFFRDRRIDQYGAILHRWHETGK